MHAKWSLLGTAIPLCVVFAAGCGSGGDNSPVSTPAASASPQAQPQVSSAPSVIPIASPSPGVATATLDVSPAEQRVGGVTLSLAFEQPRHMVDQSMMFSTANLVDPTQPTPVTTEAGSKGAIVLSEMLHVTNNMDPTQPIPADSYQAIVRHAVVQIHAADGGQPIPYLGVTLDVLLDGHPVGFGQSAVPMVAADAATPTLYYGNNVRLGQRGMYQVFVRMSHNALLGNDQPQAAQFNVLVR